MATTIRVEHSTATLLRRLGRKGETYDRIIRRLIAEAQGMSIEDFEEIRERLESGEFIPAKKIPWDRLHEIDVDEL